MRCYTVTTRTSPPLKRFAGTQADAKKTRDQLMVDADVKKKDVVIEETEVPVAKAALIQFLNDLIDSSNKEE